MDNLIAGSIILIIIVVGYFVYRALTIVKEKNIILNEFNSVSNFTSSQDYIGIDRKTMLAIDDNRMKLCLVYKKNKKIKHKVIGCNDVLSSEVIEDGKPVMKSKHMSQTGRESSSALTMTTFGAVMSGITGDRTSADKVSNIQLNITINFTDYPYHVVNFLNSKCKRKSTRYKAAMEKARYWQNLMKVLIKKADEDSKVGIQEINGSSKFSIADELRKLNELKTDGIISEEEFINQKKKLLNS
jgi:hypothetical protein